MDSKDEVRRLRRDLDEIIARTGDLSTRLEALEKGEARVTPLKEASAAPSQSKPVEPPPIPSAEPEHTGPAPVRPLKHPASGREFSPGIPSFFRGGKLDRYIRERIEEFRTKKRDLGWEVLLGTYWLPRVAVLCITIAVVFFLSLAIERWGAHWMPHLRVGIGYAVAAGLLFMAWRSEKKYGGLARVLYGGGFAVMYFVTFATHYIPFARVFANPEPTLLLLTGVIVAWAVVAQIRQSKIIAVLATVLGHLTVLLSTFTLEKPGLVSMAGLLVLSAGSAFFLLQNRWYYVAALGMLGGYLNCFCVLARGEGTNPVSDFTGSMGALTALLLIFALAELFSPEDLRRKVPVWFRSAFMTVNTVLFLVLGTMLMEHYAFTRPHEDLFRISVAGLMAVIGMAYLHVRSADSLYNVYFTKATALLTLAIATRYGGSTLSAWLAVETVLLLVSAQRSGLIVMRLLAFALGGIALIQSVSTAIHLAPIAYASPEYSRHLFEALLGVAAFLVSSQLYQRTNWVFRSPKSLPFSPDAAPEMAAFCWNLDLIAECPAQLKDGKKPLEGLLFPYVYALSGAVIFLAHVGSLSQEGHRFATVAGFALMLSAMAALLNSKPFGLAALGSLLLPALPVGAPEILGSAPEGMAVRIAGLVMVGAVALMSEKQLFGKYTGLSFHQKKASPYLLYFAGALLAIFLLIKEFPGVNGIFALAAGAVAAAGLFLVLHPAAWAIISCGYVLAGSLVFIPDASYYLQKDPERFGVAAAVLVGLSLMADRYFAFFRQRTAASPYVCALVVVNAALVLPSYFEVRIDPVWLMTLTAVAGYGFLLYWGVFRSPAALVISLVIMLYASARHSFFIFDENSLETGLVVAFVLLAVFWVLLERFYTRWAPNLNAAGRLKFLNKPENAVIPIVLATGVLLILLDRIPHLANTQLALITIGWFVLAAVLFLLSLVFRQRFYRYAGLAVILLSLGRLFLIDMKEQDPLLRVAVFAVVGAGLLFISVGYFKWMARMRGKTPDKESGEDAAST